MTIEKYCTKHHISYATFAKIVNISYSYLHANRNTDFNTSPRSINSKTLQQIYDKTLEVFGEGLVLWYLKTK